VEFLRRRLPHRQTRILGRLGVALVLLFVVNTLFNLLPLKPLDPAWQLRMADLLLTTTPFSLLGTVLIYLCQELAGGGSPALLPLRRIQRLAPLVALGFLLLIPLQAHATWVQIRTADSEVKQTIRLVEQRIAAVRALTSSGELLKISEGLPPDWQPLSEQSLSVNRARLLGRAEPELAQLHTATAGNRSTKIQKRLQDGLRDLLLSLIYAITFYGLRPGAPLSMLDDDEDDHDDPSGIGVELNQSEQHPWYP
jgi:hypothetical protein